MNQPRRNNGPKGNNYRHGMARCPEHRSWMALRNRCNCPTNSRYSRYGGRGITVCERWNDFTAFYADMGPRPSPKHSIERIDNDGSYSPENCRWATAAEQSYNRRNKTFITAMGRTMRLCEWARELGTNASTIRNRLLRGWSPDRAVSEGV